MPQEFKDENSNDVDEDVLTEADRVNNGGAESDVVKVCYAFALWVVFFRINCCAILPAAGGIFSSRSGHS